MKPLLTQQNYKEKLFELVGNEYKFTTIYTSGKMKLVHCICGHIFEMNPSDFLTKGRRCPKCSHPHSKKTNEQFLKEVNDLVGTEYTFLEPYKNKSTKLKVVHNNCGFEYSTSPDNFLNHKRRCPKCANNIKLTLPEIEKRINDKLGPDYYLIKNNIEYKNNRTGIAIMHTKCNQVSYKTINNINKQFGCKYCSDVKNSKGSKMIEEYLKENNYSFIKEYTFQDCFITSEITLRKYCLPFDFYIPSLNILIEFDGEGHFKESFTSNKEKAKISLEKRIQNDKIKNNFCAKKGITLIRISYLEINEIVKILDNKLLKESSTTIETTL